MLKQIFHILSLLILLVPTIFCSENSWKQYPYSTGNSDIEFPRDEGRHKLKVGLEWWYYVIHAKGVTSGDRYSILVTHFNTNTRFFTIANLTKKQHKSATVQGKLNVSYKGLDLKHVTKYGTDTFSNITNRDGTLKAFSYKVNVNGPQMKLDGTFSATKPPMMIGGTGYIPIGTAGHSWYYSITRSNFIGHLQLNDVSEEIIGDVWMDHQWGPFLVSPLELGGIFESYEWFCIQLSDGTDIMISDVFDRDYKIPRKMGYGQVEFIDENGNSEFTHERTFSRDKFWQDPLTKKYMSMGWTLEVPEWDLKLVLAPTLKNQMVRVPLKADFWEGSITVKGVFAGKEVTGRGFGELIHKYKIPNVKLKRMRSFYKKNSPITIKWKIKNRDEGNPLNQILLIKGDGIPPEKLYLKGSKHTFRLIHPGKYIIQIVAESIDGTISGRSKKKIIYIH